MRRKCLSSPTARSFCDFCPATVTGLFEGVEPRNQPKIEHTNEGGADDARDRRDVVDEVETELVVERGVETR